MPRPSVLTLAAIVFAPAARYERQIADAKQRLAALAPGDGSH